MVCAGAADLKADASIRNQPRMTSVMVKTNRKKMLDDNQCL
jgi:hypothetical protein